MARGSHRTAPTPAALPCRGCAADTAARHPVRAPRRPRPWFRVQRPSAHCSSRRRSSPTRPTRRAGLRDPGSATTVRTPRSTAGSRATRLAAAPSSSANAAAASARSAASTRCSPRAPSRPPRGRSRSAAPIASPRCATPSRARNARSSSTSSAGRSAASSSRAATRSSSSATSTGAPTATASPRSRWRSRWSGCSSGSRSPKARSGRLDDLAQAYVPALAGTPYGATPIACTAHDALGRVVPRGLCRSGERHLHARPPHARAGSRRQPRRGEAVRLASRAAGRLLQLLVGRHRRAGPGARGGDRSEPVGLRARQAVAAAGRRGRGELGRRRHRARKSRSRTSTRCCATGRASDACSRRRASSTVARSCRGHGWRPRGRAPARRTPRWSATATTCGTRRTRSATLLWGLRGQNVLADPETGLVLVQTALASEDFLDLELAALWTAVRSQLR